MGTTRFEVLKLPESRDSFTYIAGDELKYRVGVEENIGLKWVSGFPSVLLPPVWTEFRQMWSNLTVELVCRHVEELKKLLQIKWIDKEILIDGKVMTPDFYYEGVIYEFKTYLGVITREEEEEEIKICKEKYGSLPVKLLIITADLKFPNLFKLSTAEREYYLKRYHQYVSYLSQHPDAFLEHKKKVRSIQMPADMLFESFEFKSAFDFAFNKLKEVDYEVHKIKILESQKEMKGFLDKNVMNLDTLPDHICPAVTKAFDNNISFERPLDRDFNKAKYGTRYGHKSRSILPYVQGFFKDSEEALVHYAMKEGEFKGLIKHYKEYAEFLPVVRTLKTLLAQASSESNEETFKLVSRACNTEVHGIMAARRAIDGEITKRMKEYEVKKGIKEDADWKLTKRGTFKSKDLNILGRYHIDTKEKEVAEKKVDLDMCDVDEDSLRGWLEELKDLPKVAFPSVRLDTAYPFDSQSSALLSLTGKEGLRVVEKIWDKPVTRQLLLSSFWMRALLMAVPVTDIKRGSTREAVVFYTKETGTLTSCTLHPNDITTGLITIWQTMEEDKFKTLENTPFGSWNVVGDYSLNDKTMLVVQTTPFRMNLKFIEQFDSVIGSYLGLHVLYSGMKARELDNVLMDSMFLDFSRQLTRASEFVYVASARGAASLCFGQIEGKNKFEKLKGKDPRVALILKNCKRGWRTFRAATKQMNETGVWVPFKDPFFGLQIDSLMEFQFIEYFKQVFVKDDGFDDKKLAAGFFADDCADKLAYNESDFNPKVKPDCWYYDIETFNEKVFKGDKWAPVSFSAEFIHSCTKEHFDETTRERKGDFLASLKMSNVTDDIANSKVMMPETSWGKINEIFARSTKADGNKKDEETIKYKGLFSVKLSESVFFTIEEYFSKVEEFEGVLNKRREEKGLKGTIKLSKTEEPSAVELCLYLLWKFPNEVLLVPVNKVQTGADKRQFYIQTYNGRTQNSVLDAVFRTYLSASNYDLITKPGDEKLLTVSAEIAKLKQQHNWIKIFFSSEDQKRYGDSYPLEAFVALYSALYRCGYMSKGAFDFCLHITSTMKNRKHLMPWQMSQMLEKSEKNKERSKEDTLSMKTDLQAIQVVMDKFVNLNLGKKEADKRNSDLDDAIHKNRHLDKDIGFALGVMNIVSTCLTILHLKAVCDILRDCFPGVGVFALGHSDDSLKGTDLPLITGHEFVRARIPYLVEALSKRKRVLFNAKAETFVIETTDGESIEFKTKEATALFVCLSLYTPRLVGQRPSLFKWYFGSIGEVLQIQFTSEAVMVPSLRYAAALFKDLPGKSYATDLTAACSRVLPLIQAGVTAETVIMMQIVTTLLVRVRFGIDLERVPEVRFDKHPVLLGGYLCLPTEYIENGFDANVIRLMASAEKNQVLRRELAILMLTSSIWSGKTDRSRKDWVTTENEMAQANIQLENTQQGVVEMNKEDTLIGDTFVDFFVRFSAKVKTLQSFVRMAKAYKQHVLNRLTVLAPETVAVVAREMEPEPDNKIEESEKAIIAAIKIVSMANTHNFLYKNIDMDLKFVRMLKTYTTRSFQESYLRVPLGVKTINRLGYLSRIMGNPFNPDVDPIKKPLISIHEAVLAVQALASDPDFKIPEENESMYKLQQLVYERQISATLTRNYEFGAVDVKPSLQLKAIERSPYKLVSRNPNNMKFNFLVSETVGLLIEKISLERQDHEVDLYKIEPWLRYNDRFQENFVTLSAFIRRLQVTHDIRRALIRNADVLKKLLHGTGQRLICKLTGLDPITDMMENRAKIGMKITLTHINLSGSIEVKEMSFDKWKEASGAVVRLVVRGIFSDVDPSVFSFINRDTSIPLNLVTYLRGLISYRKDFRKSDLNSIVALFCLNENRKYMAVRQIANWNNDDASKVVDRALLKIPDVGVMLENVEINGEIKTLKSSDITAVSSVTLYDGLVVVFHVGDEGVIVAVNQVSGQFVKLLIRLAIYMSKNSSLKSKRMFDLLLKGKGDFKWSYGEDERQTLVSGSSLKISVLSNQLMYLLTNCVPNDNTNEFRVGEFVSFRGYGTVGKERIPYIWTPWIVDVMPESLKATSGGRVWDLDTDRRYIRDRLDMLSKMVDRQSEKEIKEVLVPTIKTTDLGLARTVTSKVLKALSPFYDVTKYAALAEKQSKATGIGEAFKATIREAEAEVNNETLLEGLIRTLFTPATTELVEYRRLTVLFALSKFIQSEMCFPFFLFDFAKLARPKTIYKGSVKQQSSVFKQLLTTRDKKSALRLLCSDAKNSLKEGAEEHFDNWVSRYLGLSTNLVLEESPVEIIATSSEDDLNYDIVSKIQSLKDTGSFSHKFADIIWREGLADEMLFVTLISFNSQMMIPLYKGAFWDKGFSYVILSPLIRERMEHFLKFY